MVVVVTVLVKKSCIQHNLYSPPKNVRTCPPGNARIAMFKLWNELNHLTHLLEERITYHGQFRMNLHLWF